MSIRELRGSMRKPKNISVSVPIHWIQGMLSKRPCLCGYPQRVADMPKIKVRPARIEGTQSLFRPFNG
jgi:hypothetical protein